jgi:hypothetical protein
MRQVRSDRQPERPCSDHCNVEPIHGDILLANPLRRAYPAEGIAYNHGMNETDEQHLRRAIELAAQARAAGEQPFGSLLIGPEGDVLAEDHNTVLGDRDVTAHPELKLARCART